jgi:hypothetical protein
VIELANNAEEFCSGIEAAVNDAAVTGRPDDLRTKLGLCRNLIAYIRSLPNPGVDNPLARDGLKSLITAMMWVAFHARGAMTFKLYRKLVIVEALFTHILNHEIPRYSRNGDAARHS